MLLYFVLPDLVRVQFCNVKYAVFYVKRNIEPALIHCLGREKYFRHIYIYIKICYVGSHLKFIKIIII